MSISTTVIVGVSARLSLCYENIEFIKKLFNKKSVFIYGIKHTPIDYNEQSDCFDSGILDVLNGLNSYEEFNKKAIEIAELRNDRYVTCLRRKIQYSNHNDYKNFTHDDDDYFDYSDEERYEEIQYNKEYEINIDNLFSEDDEDNSDHENKNNQNCNFVKTDKTLNEPTNQSKYKDFDCNKLIFDIFYPFSNIDANFDNNDTSCKTSYETVSYGIKSYLDNLHQATIFFKEMGIDEEKLVICNYNTCNLY